MSWWKRTKQIPLIGIVKEACDTICALSNRLLTSLIVSTTSVPRPNRVVAVDHVPQICMWVFDLTRYTVSFDTVTQGGSQGPGCISLVMWLATHPTHKGTQSTPQKVQLGWSHSFGYSAEMSDMSLSNRSNQQEINACRSELDHPSSRCVSWLEIISKCNWWYWDMAQGVTWLALKSYIKVHHTLFELNASWLV